MKIRFSKIEYGGLFDEFYGLDILYDHIFINIYKAEGLYRTTMKRIRFHKP